MVHLVWLTVMLSTAQVAPGDPAGTPNELAGAALAVFATKCVQCHGPEVPHPKAGFGFITDLRRLVASGTYAVPGKPEASEIWKQISEGDMPPDGARAGPLSPAEKDTILAWIAAGAPPPDGPAGTDRAPEGVPRAGPGPERAGEPLLRRAARLVGRAHVMVVHFPVAMLVVGALAEAWAWARGVRAPLPAVRFCLWVGSVSAVLAGGLGWVHALDGFPGPTANPLAIAGLHRWIGAAATLLAPLVALLVERDARRGQRTLVARGAVLGLGAAVGVAAHFGGLLTHGAGFFDP